MKPLFTNYFLYQYSQGRRRSSSTDGFSLTEVIAVIMLLVVLFAIIGPGFVTFINSRRANAVRDEVLQGLRSAQEKAIRDRTPSTMQIVISPNGIPTVQVDQGDLGNSGSNGLQPGMVGITSNPPGVNQVQFMPDGTVNPNINLPLTFIVSSPADGEAKRCVAIDSILGAINTYGTGERDCI
ncbi:GspH/FimT family pseudopilin [Leptolyngbya sp. AN02str]|uniref:GspH/FimT family pseudopilin n=1 Tax=Leptolyngbya sp. AN02str TaxID=3423363 RepID=UPI003D31E98D